LKQLNSKSTTEQQHSE